MRLRHRQPETRNDVPQQVALAFGRQGLQFVDRKRSGRSPSASDRSQQGLSSIDALRRPALRCAAGDRQHRASALRAAAISHDAGSCDRNADPRWTDLPPRSGPARPRILRVISRYLKQWPHQPAHANGRIEPIPARPAGPLPRIRLSNRVSAWSSL